MPINRRSFLKTGLLALTPMAPRAMAFGGRPTQMEAPLFSFGVATDIQYADKHSGGARHYRNSLLELKRCVDFWNAEKLEFVIQLGDLVDTGGIPTLRRMFSVYDKAQAKKYSVLGNHDFVAPRDQVMHELRMSSAYYSFKTHGWRFVVLDGMHVSIHGGWPTDDPHYLTGQEINTALQKSDSPIAGAWNGAVGEAQRHWLARELADASARAEKVIVFCHLPTLPGSCRPDLLLWDHAEVVQVLDTCPTLVAYMCGHDHPGGYGMRHGVHYMTLPGMVEHDAGDSSFIVDVHADRLTIRTLGVPPLGVQQKTFAFPARSGVSGQRATA